MTFVYTQMLIMGKIPIPFLKERRTENGNHKNMKSIDRGYNKKIRFCNEIGKSVLWLKMRLKTWKNEKRCKKNWLRIRKKREDMWDKNWWCKVLVYDNKILQILLLY